ncbi:MAG: Lipase-like protein [Myxococcales bacterium]|nr:Lipase-like protein [Myxococcales bacterium]
MYKLALWNVVAIVAAGCSDLSLEPSPQIVHARFDPEARVIPMPTDVLRDAVARRLDLPNDTEADRAKLLPAEAEFYDYLETLDGWSSLMSGTVQFTGAIDPASVGDATVQVWHWGTVPQRVADVRVSVSADGKTIAIDPPRTGWERGARYVAVLRGGANGVVGLAGERVECDAAFYFLRQTTPLDTPEHEHAFPGETQAERQANAQKLEKIRKDLAAPFDFFASSRALPRDEVAALWAFTVTTRTELAMDQPSQRMPLPIDLMIDPATGRVDAPPAPWDSATEAEAKAKLSDFDGMSLSGGQLFEFTGPMAAATLTEATIKLYKLEATPQQVPARVELLADHQHVVVTPKSGRLDEKTRYAVVLSKDLRDAAGLAPTIMPVGHLVQSHAPILVDGASQVPAITARDATKLEHSRTELAATLDVLGRDQILAAWPFTTMSVSAPLVALRKTSESMGIAADPDNIVHMTPGEALVDFPFGIGSILNVGAVYHGTIKTPSFLDHKTRAFRRDGGNELIDVKFTLTVPKNPKPGPIPVVIFGHGLVTERRFVLAVGDSLAAKGYAAVSIDFPYHGDRSYCATGGPISLVDPLNGSLVSLNPCASGTTCNDEGRCVDGNGNGNKLATFGVISTPVASGAVFLEIDHIANSKDHFGQALIDLGSLDRSLRTGNWQGMLGRPVDTARIYYSGQSLGGIMGAVFLGTDPDIKRAVLNVPGANLIPLFDDSTFFSAQLDAFFTRQHIDRASFEGRRFLSVAHWFMDAVDPEHLGPITGNRALMLQMATLDGIIPNANTKTLQDVTHAPRRDYLAEHGFLTIPIEPEYFRGTSELASFLSGELTP